MTVEPISLLARQSRGFCCIKNSPEAGELGAGVVAAGGCVVEGDMLGALDCAHAGVMAAAAKIAAADKAALANLIVSKRSRFASVPGTPEGREESVALGRKKRKCGR